MTQTTLPPESRATLSYIARDVADFKAGFEADYGVRLSPADVAYLVDRALGVMTQETARELSARVAGTLN